MGRGCIASAVCLRLGRIFAGADKSCKVYRGPEFAMYPRYLVSVPILCMSQIALCRMLSGTHHRIGIDGVPRLSCTVALTPTWTKV